MAVNGTSSPTPNASRSGDIVLALPFPRSMLPDVGIFNGDVGLSAIVGNIALVLVAGVATRLLAAYYERKDSRHHGGDGTGECVESRVWGGDGACCARARFPALMITCALFVLDGTAYAATADALRSNRSGLEGDADITWLRYACVAAGMLFCVMVLSGVVVTVVRCPLHFVPHRKAATGLPPSQPPQLTVAGRIARLLLHVRGEWRDPPVVLAAPPKEEDESLAAVAATDGGPTSIIIILSRPGGGSEGEQEMTTMMTTTADRNDEEPRRTLGDSPASMRVPLPLPLFLSVYRPLLAPVRSGPEGLHAVARYGVAVDAVLTIAAATVEAWGTAMCAPPAAMAGSIIVSALGFLFLFFVAPHPSPVKASLSATNAALGVVVSVLMYCSVRGVQQDGEVSLSVTVAIWRLRRQYILTEGTSQGLPGCPGTRDSGDELDAATASIPSVCTTSQGKTNGAALAVLQVPLVVATGAGGTGQRINPLSTNPLLPR